MTLITQEVSSPTPLPDPPNPAFDGEQEFDDKAYPYTVAQNVFGLKMQQISGEINIVADQINVLALEINDNATNAANSALEAKAARDEAVNAVAVLPDGTINDSILSPVDAWSSQKISDELAKKVNILDMDELTQDIIGNSIIGSSGIVISYDDNTGDTTISFSGSSGYSNMRVFNTSGIFDISTAKGAGRYFVEVVGATGFDGPFGGAGNSGGGGGGGGGYVFGFADITANVTVTIAARGYGGGITSFGGFCSAQSGNAGASGGGDGFATGGAGGTGRPATVGSGFIGKALQGHDGTFGESGGYGRSGKIGTSGAAGNGTRTDNGYCIVWW